MSNTATAIASVLNLNALGIQDIEKAVTAGKATVHEAYIVVQARIDKRLASGATLLAPVVEYRNTLAQTLNATAGRSIPMLKVPSYAKAKANTDLPTDPDQLADVVFATVGAANVGAVISRLTARVIGA